MRDRRLLSAAALAAIPDSCRFTPSIAWRFESPIDGRHGQGHMDHQRLANMTAFTHTLIYPANISTTLPAPSSSRSHQPSNGINPAKSKQRHSIRHCRPYLFQQRQLNLFRQLRASMAERNCTVRGTRTTQDNYLAPRYTISPGNRSGSTKNLLLTT